MSGDQKRQLEQQLWNIANELRGKMNADEFRDYILGFIFYKYLSEKQYLYANKLLKGEKTDDYRQLSDPELLAAIKMNHLKRWVISFCRISCLMRWQKRETPRSPKPGKRKRLQTISSMNSTPC